LHRQEIKLPNFLSSLFWDCSFEKLNPEQNRDFIVFRIITSGGLKAYRWMRSNIGDSEIRECIIRRNGRGLTPPQLRFWELILDMSHEQVDRWVDTAKQSSWWRKGSRDVSS